MNEPDDPIPLGLRTSTDLDGLHIELSAHQTYFTDPQRRTATLLSSFVAVGASLAIGALVDPWIAPFALVLSYMIWLGAGDLGAPRSTSQHLVLGAHRFIARGEPVTFDVPWTSIGRVSIHGGISPTLQLNVHATAPLVVPMQNEPSEHAAWLRTTIETRARQARLRAGAHHEVPAALRPLRTAE